MHELSKFGSIAFCRNSLRKMVGLHEILEKSDLLACATNFHKIAENQVALNQAMQNYVRELVLKKLQLWVYGHLKSDY